jgi:uncharacterized membrane protein YdjX (TVP38/TMEM64 family)
MDDKRKLLILFVLIFFVFFVSRFTPLKKYTTLERLRGIKKMAEFHPYKGVLLFMTISILFVVIGVPKSIVCVGGGLIFGFWKGLLLASTAVITGSFVIFIVARLLGAPFFYKRLKRYLKIVEKYKGNQFIMVLLLKQIPLPCLLNNTLLGLAPISTPIFILGSFVGQLPSNIVFTLYGSSVHGYAVLKISLATVMIVLLFICVKFLTSKSKLLKELS